MANELALITGASSGIGEAFARQLAERGYDLCITARRGDQLSALAAELREKHQVNVNIIVADLATDEGMDNVITWIKDTPALTMLINNAGFGTRGMFVHKPAEVYAAMVSVHVMASMRLTSAALPAMIKSRRGAIINVSSLTAYMPLGGNAVYSGTKSFLNAFTEALAFEVKGTGVKVQLLAPGFTYSDFHKRPEYSNVDTYSSVPKFMWMNADDVARISLRALEKNKTVCIPGTLNKLIAFAGKSGLAALGSAVMIRRYKKAKVRTTEKP